MTKVALDLELIIPGAATGTDPCVPRLLAQLRGRPGVVDAHLVEADGHARLCVHFEPDVVTLARIEALVAESGAALAARYGHLNQAVDGVHHERHARLIEAALAREPGVLHASVSAAGRLALEYDTTVVTEAQVLTAVRAAGLRMTDRAEGRARAPDDHAGHDHGAGGPARAAVKDDHGADDGHDHAHGGPFGARSELIFSLLCGVLTGAGWLLGRLDVDTVPRILFVLAYGLGAWFTVQEVVVAIRARRFEIDFLMLFAAGGAAVLGEWFEGALLLFLFSLGHGLEGYAMARAKGAITSLAKLVPATALRLRPAGGEDEVAVEVLAVGDQILVKPNTRIPADGVIVAGHSAVDQAPVTGESVPVDKRPVADLARALAEPTRVEADTRVFAGTINGAGVLTIAVTRAAADSTLARVARMVAEAETQKSRTQQLTDRFERIFVPVILAFVVALLFAWGIIDEPFSASFYRAMAVLVAASPCALAIATPSAVLSGVARAARGGVLIKGGAHLESLGTVTAMAFDKTGTVTEGKPKLTDVVPAPGVDEARLLAVTAAVEEQSDHPLAFAIVQGARERLGGQSGLDAVEVEAITGFGIRAKVESKLVRIGKLGLFTRDGGTILPAVEQAAQQLQADGRTVMVVEEDGRFLGVVGVMDTPRPVARPVLAELRALGVARTIILTGDNQQVADNIARQLGITEARGDLLPEAKVAAIIELTRTAGAVAMVGDGVNDAPAMARATVGITMGAGGSDVAMETADVALMADDLRALPFAVGLSRSCRRIIRQNLWASLGMVAFLVPATLLGFAGIGIAVALHEGSTLLVVANALRLLAYRDPRSQRPPAAST